MKKPGQSAQAKTQNRVKKQERRNFQVQATKRTGVHPAIDGLHPVSNVIDGRIMTHVEEAQRDAELGIEPTDGNGVANGEIPSTEPAVPYRPIKLNEAMIARFVESIRETGGPSNFIVWPSGFTKRPTTTGVRTHSGGQNRFTHVLLRR